MCPLNNDKDTQTKDEIFTSPNDAKKKLPYFLKTDDMKTNYDDCIEKNVTSPIQLHSACDHTINECTDQESRMSPTVSVRKLSAPPDTTKLLHRKNSLPSNSFSKELCMNPDVMKRASLNKVEKEYICVLGAGSFGTAIGSMFARNGHDVVLLDRNAERAKTINTSHRNPSYLKDLDLPECLWATTDADVAFKNCTLVFHAIPVQSSEAYLKQYVGKFSTSTPIICMSKGIHCETLKFMNDIITDVFGPDQISAYLSGPSFAKEIVQGEPTGLVVASSCSKTAYRVANTIANDPSIRAWTTSDVIGVEVGGALKNIYAIGAGIVQGAGYGYNTTALIVTRGCLEMAKLANRLGAKEKTLSGLTGIGDLMLTCFGPASRNRSVGERIGQGETLNDILSTMKEVAEGVPTIRSAVKLATNLGILDQLPLLQAIHDIVFGNVPRELLASYILSFPVTDEMS